MLLYFKFRTKENEPEKEDINRALNGRMAFNFFPCLFHFFAPMNIIKNKNGVVICFRQQMVEVVDRWAITVVSIYVSQIDR